MYPNIFMHNKSTDNLVPWQGHRIPYFRNDFCSKSFELFLPCTKCLWENDPYMGTNPAFKSFFNKLSLNGGSLQEVIIFGLFYQH